MSNTDSTTTDASTDTSRTHGLSDDADVSDGYQIIARAKLEMPGSDIERDTLTALEAKARSPIRDMILGGQLSLETVVKPLDSQPLPDTVGYTHPTLEETFPVNVSAPGPGLPVDTADHTFRSGDVLETRDDTHPDQYYVILEATSAGLILYDTLDDTYTHWPPEWVRQDFDDEMSTGTEYIIHPGPGHDRKD